MGEGVISSALRMVAAQIPSAESFMAVVLESTLVGLAVAVAAAAAAVEVVVVGGSVLVETSVVAASLVMVVVVVRGGWVGVRGAAEVVELVPRAAAREEAAKFMVVMVLMWILCVRG